MEMTERGKNEIWDGPPPPPDAELVESDISCVGVLGLTLKSCLEEIQIEDISKPSPKRMDDEKVDAILKSLGRAVAESQAEQNSPIRNNDGGGSNKKRAVVTAATAPAALLRGRLDYFNRRNSKWRLVARDVEIRKRGLLDPGRRRREKPSLWLTSQERQPAELPLKSSMLEILAYDDII